VIGNGSAVVDGDVPVLDSDVFAILLDVWENGDITYYQKKSSSVHTCGVDILDTFDLEVFIDFDASVPFKLDLGFLEELGGWADSNGHDDNVSGDTRSVFQFDRTDMV